MPGGWAAVAYVIAWALVSACAAHDDAASDAATPPSDAATLDAAAPWAPSPVRLTDQPLEVALHSPSGRYVVAVDEADPAYVLLDTEGERPPRRLPTDQTGYGINRPLFSANEKVVAYLNGDNLVVADVAGTDPERVMGAWQAGYVLGPGGINNINEDSQWLVELSGDGKWILWTLDGESETGSQMLRVASTDGGVPIVAERIHVQSWDERPFHCWSATFVDDDVVLYAPVEGGHVLARYLDSGTVQDLGPGSRFLAVSPPRVLVWNDLPGPLSVVRLDTGAGQRLTEDVRSLDGDRSGRYAAYMAGDDLWVLDSETLESRRLGLFPDFAPRQPGFTGTSDALVLGERSACEACDRSSLFVGLDGTASVLSTAGGVPFPLAHSGVVVIAEPWVMGSDYYVRAPGEERRLLGHEVLLRIKSSSDGRRIAFVDGTIAMPELKVLDVEADTITATGWGVRPEFQSFGFGDNGALVGDVGTRIYSDLDRPAPKQLALAVSSMDILPRDRVAYATALGVFVVSVPAP